MSFPLPFPKKIPFSTTMIIRFASPTGQTGLQTSWAAWTWSTASLPSLRLSCHRIWWGRKNVKYFQQTIMSQNMNSFEQTFQLFSVQGEQALGDLHCLLPLWPQLLRDHQAWAEVWWRWCWRWWWPSLSRGLMTMVMMMMLMTMLEQRLDDSGDGDDGDDD